MEKSIWGFLETSLSSFFMGCFIYILDSSNFSSSHFELVSLVLKAVSLKIEPLQYITKYYDGSIFNETDITYMIV